MKNKGPSTWGRFCKEANGKHQSPIDIDTKNTVYDPELANKPLRFNYSKDCFTVLKNSGHSFTVSGADGAASSKIFKKVKDIFSFYV
jgi:carbonic anhydrase